MREHGGDEIGKLSETQQAMVDECIEKYMQSFKVVQRAVHSEIELN